jgi:hypothetical protein
MINNGSSSPRIQESFFGIVKKLGQFVNNVLRRWALVRSIYADKTFDRYRKTNQQPRKWVIRIESITQVHVTCCCWASNKARALVSIELFVCYHQSLRRKKKGHKSQVMSATMGETMGDCCQMFFAFIKRSTWAYLFLKKGNLLYRQMIH